MKVLVLVVVIGFNLVHSRIAKSAQFPNDSSMRRSLLSVNMDQPYLRSFYPLLLQHAGTEMGNAEVAEVFLNSCSVFSASERKTLDSYNFTECLKMIPQWLTLLFKESDVEEIDHYLAFRYTLGADDFRCD